MGVEVGWQMLPADLTLTRMGAFLFPFAPTFVGERLQTDMLLTRTILPLSYSLAATHTLFEHHWRRRIALPVTHRVLSECRRDGYRVYPVGHN